MKNSKKLIFSRTVSGILAFLTVFALMASLSLIPVFADESSTDNRLLSDIYTDYYTNPSYDPAEKKDTGWEKADFTSPEKRLAKMKLMITGPDKKNYFSLYVDEITGEVALKDNNTGDIMFSNPYDISEYSLNSISSGVKTELLSQINISYSDNGQQSTYYSFTDAALLGQITVKKLRGGIRVEYSIGEEETRTLVPRRMSEERFEEMIKGQLLANIPSADGETVDEEHPIYMKATAFYESYSLTSNPNNLESIEAENNELLKEYPALETYSRIYAFTGENYREIKQTERYIKMYCPKYTFEELDKDHNEMGYTTKDKAPANFRLALEYYLDDFGVRVRMPANGLSFDETSYELNSISILPYMGAGSGDYKGYTFIPDGSGTLMRFEDVERYFNVTGKVYGDDYAYQEISGSNQEVFRMPVFGVVTTDTPMNGALTDRYPGYIENAKTHDAGYVAIITQGDALASITSLNGGGSRHIFNSAYSSFNPRPKDAYNLADAISVGGDSKVTVVSERKYTGSFQINYIMLTDPDLQNDARSYYDTSYVGMAKAYRDYLEKTGTISRLTSEDVSENIPLYIESFGATEDEESFLSIPVTVKKALTTFDQLEKMVNECQKNGITNIGLKLTGFVNGGMYPTVPTKVKFEKSVGGNDGFMDFLKFAAKKGVSVYPEFDFAYMSDTAAFDGFSYSSDAVKTIDNRYITKREYSAVLQTFSTTGKICISPCVYRDYFESFDESFKDILGKVKTNVSLGTLGSDINSDFDDEDPYNREDAKNFTLDLLKSFKVSGSYGDIMVNSGNAYAMQYADVVLNAPLDSSRYAYASEAVPFFGMVYHGYVVFAGSPTNMAGDIKYETLKILENGATLYMMLSYDNVELLKEDEYLSRYYAVDYNIWKDTLFDNKSTGALGLYSKLNNALKSVQTSVIDDHGFISCMRKFTDAERQNIREDALRYHENGNADISISVEGVQYTCIGSEAAEDNYRYWLNIRDIYRSGIKRNKQVLQTAGIYDNRTKLTELNNLYPAVLEEGEYDAIMAYTYGEGEDEVVVNRPVLEAIVKILTEKNLSEKATYEGYLNTYDNTFLDTLIAAEYYDIKAITDKINSTGFEYNLYVGQDGQDSYALTEIIKALTATYDSNRVINDGSVVFVKYYNETTKQYQYFILNYNSYVVEIEKADLIAAGVDATNFEDHIEIGAKDFYVKGGTH